MIYLKLNKNEKDKNPTRKKWIKSEKGKRRETETYSRKAYINLFNLVLQRVSVENLIVPGKAIKDDV